jgi:CheY-like chemotaxis protein
MSTKKTVFVVDDDQDALDQLTLILEAAGYEVKSACSQPEAEELFLSGRPDLAVLDLMMEQLDSGLVLCHYLKKLYPDVPVIMLTAVAGATGLSMTPANAEAQSWVKADMVMDKPARAEQVRAAIHRLLKEPGDAVKGHAH